MGMRWPISLVVAVVLAGCPDLSGFSGGGDATDAGAEAAVDAGGGGDAGGGAEAGADASVDAGANVVFTDHFDDRTTPQGVWDAATGLLTIEAAPDAPSGPNVLHSVIQPTAGVDAYLTKAIPTPGATHIECAFAVKLHVLTDGSFLTTSFLRGAASFPDVRLDLTGTEWHVYGQRAASDQNGIGDSGTVSAKDNWLHVSLAYDAKTTQAIVRVESAVSQLPLSGPPDLSKIRLELGIHFARAGVTQEAYFDDVVCTAD